MSIPSGWNVVTGAEEVNVLLHPDQAICGEPSWQQRCEGLCSLDVSVQDGPPIAYDVAPAFDNAALKIRVRYRSGAAGGMLVMDAPVGGMVTIGAVTVISASAFFEPTIAGAVVTPVLSQRVDISAHWRTSRDGLVAQYSAPAVVAAADPGGSAWVRIPPKAARMSVLALATDPTGVVAQFATQAAVASLVYETIVVGDRSEDAVPVVAGARFVRFQGAGTIRPVFQLAT